MKHRRHIAAQFTDIGRILTYDRASKACQRHSIFSDKNTKSLMPDIYGKTLKQLQYALEIDPRDCHMKNSTSRKLALLLLVATTSASLSVLPGSAQTGDKQVQNNGATTSSAAPSGGTTSSGTTSSGTTNSPGETSKHSDAVGSEQTKQPKKTKHHEKTAANGSEPRSDKWDSFHKQGTDVGGHKNTDSGFDFQHGNEKL